MLACVGDAEADEGPRNTPAAAARLCVATRIVRPVAELIRFVAGPDGVVVPDLRRRLPGRGVWVTASHGAVAEAVRRHAFSRSLRSDAKAPADLPVTVDRLLEQSALNALSMTYKAGLAIFGFVRVETALPEGRVVALIRARDAGREGGRKLAALATGRAGRPPGAMNIVEAFTSAQLDLAFGRLNVVHAALLAGRASETFLARWRLLESFRVDEPGDRTLGSPRPNDSALESGS